MNKLTDRAYAKINLFLEVVGKRPDGYHELETIFHQIDLYDNISIAISKTKKNESNISLSCPKLDIFPEQNIAYKAAKLFCEKFNVKDHINITIEKNIPVGAGLGGGSSDAAAVLRLLADHYLQDQDKSLNLTLSPVFTGFRPKTRDLNLSNRETGWFNNPIAG